MSVPSTTVHTDSQRTSQSAKPQQLAAYPERFERSRATSLGGSQAKDTVSLSADSKNAYRDQQADLQTSTVAPRRASSRSAQVSSSEMRELRSQMRRLSIEASQSRAFEQSDSASDANNISPTTTEPAAEIISTEEGTHASFTPLAEGPFQSSASGGETSDEPKNYGDAPPQRRAEPESQNATSNVDSAASLTKLDHALGRIVRDRTTHGADFESLAAATRLSVRQRESIAVAHGDGGGHELTRAAAQAERTARSHGGRALPPTGAVSSGAKFRTAKSSRRA